MALSIGSLLAGRYEITAPIATGGMGEVWKARDRVLDRIVAAKVLKTEYTNDPSFLARFRNEARHTAALSHPNIASVYDYGETTDDTGVQTLAFLVMEFVEGQPLVTILHEEGRLPVDWTLHVLSQSADGLSAAHRAGVVHRDIKPGNLIVRPDGVVKLTDFGIAQARDAAPLTRTGMVVGTAQYLSPEQAQGMEVTAASDVYSLGVVAYECLAGTRPFDGASQVAIALAHINRPPPPLPGDIPPAVRLLVDRALAKDAADRFPDGGAFADAIRRVAEGGTLAAAATTVNAPATAPTQVVGMAGAADGHTQVFATPATGMRAVSPGTGAGPMPPLQATPDDDWPGDREPPAERRRGRGAWIAAAAVLLLLLGGLVWFLLAGDGPGEGEATPRATTSAPVSATPTGAFLDPANYIGRNAEDVETELEAAGLEVTREPATDARLEALDETLRPDDVAGVSPEDVAAPPGTPVTLFVAADGYTPEVAPQEPVESEEPAPTTAPETTPPAPRSTAPPAATTSSAVPTTSAAPTTTAGGVPAPAPSPGAGEAGEGGEDAGSDDGQETGDTAGDTGTDTGAAGPSGTAGPGGAG